MLCGIAKIKEKRKGSPKSRSDQPEKQPFIYLLTSPLPPPSPANAAPKSASGLGAQVLM